MIKSQHVFFKMSKSSYRVVVATMILDGSCQWRFVPIQNMNGYYLVQNIDYAFCWKLMEDKNNVAWLDSCTYNDTQNDQHCYFKIIYDPLSGGFYLQNLYAGCFISIGENNFLKISAEKDGRSLTIKSIHDHRDKFQQIQHILPQAI